MNINNLSDKREKTVQRYVSALDSGNLDDIILVLTEATKDPVLDQMIFDVNEAIEQEDNLTTIANDANLVRNLIQEHFANPETGNEKIQITIGDVAARMQADRKIPSTDQEIHKHLLRINTPLPEILNIQAIHELAKNMRLVASDKFWRVFRDTAIMLGIGRGQAHMAATRKQSKNKSKENNHRDVKDK